MTTFCDWDNYKENIVPLKRGRGAEDLAAKAEMLINYKAKVEEIMNSYQEKISQAKYEAKEAAGDPSKVEVLIKMYSEIYTIISRQVSDRKSCRVVLEHATKDLLEFPAMKNDFSLLKFWIEYADLSESPTDIFSFMFANRIGTKNALFWISWAFLYERQERYYEVELIYLAGLREDNCEPKVQLMKRYKEFLKRLKKKYIKFTTSSNDSDMDIEENNENNSFYNSHIDNNLKLFYKKLEDFDERDPNFSKKIKNFLNFITNSSVSPNCDIISFIQQNHHKYLKHPSESIVKQKRVPLSEKKIEEIDENLIQEQSINGLSKQQNLFKNNNNNNFTIFEDKDIKKFQQDENNFNSLNTNWNFLASESERTKENQMPIDKWTDVTIPSKSLSSMALPSSLPASQLMNQNQFQVYIEEQFLTEEEKRSMLSTSSISKNKPDFSKHSFQKKLLPINVQDPFNLNISNIEMDIDYNEEKSKKMKPNATPTFSQSLDSQGITNKKNFIFNQENCFPSSSSPSIFPQVSSAKQENIKKENDKINKLLQGEAEGDGDGCTINTKLAIADIESMLFDCSSPKKELQNFNDQNKKVNKLNPFNISKKNSLGVFENGLGSIEDALNSLNDL